MTCIVTVPPRICEASTYVLGSDFPLTCRRHGVGVGGSRGASTPTKVLICQKFGQNLKKLGEEALTFISNIDAVILLSLLNV